MQTIKSYIIKKESVVMTLIVSLCLVSCGSKLADVPEGSETITIGDNEIMMVYIQPGTFTMGGTSKQKDCDFYSEKPEHKVVIS